MQTLNRLCNPLIVFIISASLFDFFFTRQFILNGGEELNPLFKHLFESHMFMEAFVLKMSMTIAFVLVLKVLFNHWTAAVGLVIMALLYLVLISVQSVFWISM